MRTVWKVVMDSSAGFIVENLGKHFFRQETWASISCPRVSLVM